MLYYGIYAKQESPRAATFIWGFAALVLTYFANVFMANGIATTPFTPIDKHLLHVDQLLGVHTLKLMAWTHYHTSIRKLLNFAYESLVLQLLIIPFSLACLNARQRLRMFLNAQLATFLIGGMIYYFFPTTAPSGILHSPYFTHLQLDTSLRFYEVHHFLPVTSNKGGLIAFPSFHVVWAILLTYCTIKYKWIFYPLVVLNCFLVVSTVFLGWHYLVDAIAGGVLGFLGIYFGKICEIRSNHI